MQTFVRLMVLKVRYGWGYRTLVAEVRDPRHLRRFCRVALFERVPDESTVCKLTRRLGPEVVAELSRALIVKVAREKRFRRHAVRIDSTVIEADINYPTDADSAAHGVKALARVGRKLAHSIGETRAKVLGPPPKFHGARDILEVSSAEAPEFAVEGLGVFRRLRAG